MVKEIEVNGLNNIAWIGTFVFFLKIIVNIEYDF
jgi:hypothetical protein